MNAKKNNSPFFTC